MRLVFHTGAQRVLGRPGDRLDRRAGALPTGASGTILNGRAYDFYYSGSHLHMVVLRAHGATYWVVNTLLDSLSNETMIAIAKGLKPLTAVK